MGIELVKMGLFAAAIFGGIYYFVVNKVTGCDFKCSLM